MPADGEEERGMQAGGGDRDGPRECCCSRRERTASEIVWCSVSEAFVRSSSVISDAAGHGGKRSELRLCSPKVLDL